MYKKIFLLLLVATIAITAFTPLASTRMEHSWTYISKTRTLIVKASLPNGETIEEGFININTPFRHDVLAIVDAKNSSVAAVRLKNVKPGTFCSFASLTGVKGTFFQSNICFTVRDKK